MASKRTIDTLKLSIQTDYFTDSVVVSALSGAKGVRGKIFRLLQSADIIRLKNGFYVLGELHRKQHLNVFKIANALYGPSYISLESALSYYDLIPEAVVEVTSVNINRKKVFSTPIANFIYRKVWNTAFAHGVVQVDSESSRFLIASPEKALLDKLYLDAEKHVFFNFITKNLRIESNDLLELNLETFAKLATYYQNKRFLKRVNKLIKTLKGLKP